MPVQERTAIRERRYPVVASSVTPSMREQTRRIAQQRGTTVSLVIRAALSEYLDRQATATTGQMA